MARQCAWAAARIWLVVFALVYVLQRSFIYQPSGGEVSPDAVGFKGFEAVRLARPDGASNVVWAAPAQQGQPTVLYFHGNGGGLQNRATPFAHFRKVGWGIFAMSYRSYSGSTGSPSEANNIADAIAAYDALRARGVAADDIVLYGESLGTGVAVQVAAQRDVRAVVLESPYSSVADVAASQFPFLPVHAVIKDPYNSVQHVQGVRAPILVLHGARDQIIPVRFGQRLAAAIPGAKRYVEYPNGGHIGLFSHGAFAEVQAWVGTSSRHAATEPKR